MNHMPELRTAYPIPKEFHEIPKNGISLVLLSLEWNFAQVPNEEFVKTKPCFNSIDKLD